MNLQKQIQLLVAIVLDIIISAIVLRIKVQNMCMLMNNLTEEAIKGRNLMGKGMDLGLLTIIKGGSMLEIGNKIK